MRKSVENDSECIICNWIVFWYSQWFHIFWPIPPWLLRKDTDCLGDYRNTRWEFRMLVCWNYGACDGHPRNVNEESWLLRMLIVSTASESNRISFEWFEPYGRFPSGWWACKRKRSVSLIINSMGEVGRINVGMHAVRREGGGDNHLVRLCSRSRFITCVVNSLHACSYFSNSWW